MNASPAALRVWRSLVTEIPVEERLNLSVVLFVTTYNPVLEDLKEQLSIEHGLTELRDFEFAGVDVEKGYIITCQKTELEPQPA